MESKHESSVVESGHEPNAVDVRAIWLAGVALVATVIVALVLIAALLQYGTGSAIVPSGVAAQDRDETFPPASVPDLSADQGAQLQRLRAREHQILNEYAWVDRQAGVARVPIERAIEMVSNSRLPTATVSPAADRDPEGE